MAMGEEGGGDGRTRGRVIGTPDNIEPANPGVGLVVVVVAAAPAHYRDWRVSCCRIRRR